MTDVLDQIIAWRNLVTGEIMCEPCCHEYRKEEGITRQGLMADCDTNLYPVWDDEIDPHTVCDWCGKEVMQR